MRPSLPRHVLWIVSAGAVVLFVFSSLRHWGVRSTALDLGFFDQAVYLISQGATPVVSISGFHVLGDHAAWILYPIAVFYWIYPDVHWLLALQAIALAGAAIPLWLLMQRAQVPAGSATAVVIAYLLYPGVFSVNLLDFHPDVFAIPAFLGAILAMRSGRIGWFIACIVIITGCKELMSLPIAALGVWLLLFESRAHAGPQRTRVLIMGAIALGVGAAWLYVSTQVIIPAFGGPNVARGRYDYLGGSLGEILTGLVRHPDVVWSHLSTRENGEYLLIVLLPVAWALSWRALPLLIGAAPTLLVNMLSTVPLQRGLWYSIPVIPFVFAAGARTMAAARPWRRHPVLIVVWALVGFWWLISVPNTLFAIYRPERQESRRRVMAALNHITTNGGVLTTNDIAPQLTHRPYVKLAIRGFDQAILGQVDYVLLNVVHPGLFSSPQFAGELVAKLQQDPGFCERYAVEDVHLFVRSPGGCGGERKR